MFVIKTVSFRRKAALVPLVAALALSSACSGDKPEQIPSSTTPATTSTAPAPKTTAPRPTPKPKPVAAPVNPLTGDGRPLAKPAIAIKIDDVPAAHPHVGTHKADVVYIEEVEYGLTRLVAIFYTDQPEVGPVRSVRTNDPQILGAYGPIAFGASGGAQHSINAVLNSQLKVVMDGNSGLYYRDGSRSAPHNLFVHAGQLAASADGARPPKHVGFNWNSATAALRSRPNGSSIDTTVGNTAVSFRYSPAARKYIRYIGGSPVHTVSGDAEATPNVIVQFCTVTVDTQNAVSRFSHTVGRGKVQVFRNGKRIDGTWSRAATTHPTKYRDGKGKPIELAPGGVWVVLVAKGVAVRSS